MGVEEMVMVVVVVERAGFGRRLFILKDGLRESCVKAISELAMLAICRGGSQNQRWRGLQMRCELKVDFDAVVICI